MKPVSLRTFAITIIGIAIAFTLLQAYVL